MVSVYDFDVECGNCSSIVSLEPPSSRRLFAWSGAAILGLILGALGTIVGVASAGVGFIAWPFTGPVGLYAGYKLGAWTALKREGVTCPDCGHGYS